jgi:hypothetical protein
MATRLAGTGLAPGGLRITGRALADIPLPRDADAWEEGARAFSAWVDAGSPAGAVAHWAEPLLAAHGIEGRAATELLRWWHPRALDGGEGPAAYASGP